MIFVVLFRGERTVAVVVAAFLLFVLLAHLLLPLTRRERERARKAKTKEKRAAESGVGNQPKLKYNCRYCHYFWPTFKAKYNAH